MLYDHLPPHLQSYLDALLEHAETALWPERRTALASFHRGIEACSEETIEAAAEALGLVPPPGESRANALFRLLLTAYLERLGEAEVTNPDQALLYSLSFDEAHLGQAKHWYAAHPEHGDGGA